MRTILLSLAFAALACAQDTAAPTNKAQITHIRELAKGTPENIRELSGLLKDPDRLIRLQAVKAIIKLGSSNSLEPLVTATHDEDPEVRIRATDGIVNFYLPGFLAGNNLSGYFTRGIRQMRGFFSSRNDQVIDADVAVRDDVAQAITQEINFQEDQNEARSNAALAAGILLLKPAAPELVKGLHSKDNDVIYECLIALQKIKDPSAGPGVGFLVRDLDERTQVTALETVGVLKNSDAAPDVRYAVENARSTKIRRAALSSLAMLSVPEDRSVFKRYAINSDPELRAAALEGLGRVREPEDTPMLQASFDEANADWRIHLAAAFAMVNEGNVSTELFSPLLYLVENLNTRGRADTADAYLRELMQRDDVRKSIVNVLPAANRSQKVALCWIFASSPSTDLLPALQKLANDSDAEVATAAKRAAHVLETRRS